MRERARTGAVTKKGRAVSDDTIRQTRRERERQRTREDILEAALVVFSRAGYHNATIGDIARQAGYSTGALYNYFKGKQDLFASLVRGIMESLTERIGEVLAEAPDFSSGLDRMLQLGADFSVETATGYRFLFDPETHVAFASKDLHEFAEAQFWQIVELLTGLMQRGIDEGVLREQHPTVAAHALIALSSHFARGFTARREGDPELTPEIYVALTRDHFLCGAGRPPVSQVGGGT